jgi:hypothetical protein
MHDDDDGQSPGLKIRGPHDHRSTGTCHGGLDMNLTVILIFYHRDLGYGEGR